MFEEPIGLKKQQQRTHPSREQGHRELYHVFGEEEKEFLQPLKLCGLEELEYPGIR